MHQFTEMIWTSWFFLVEVAWVRTFRLGRKLLPLASTRIHDITCWEYDTSAIASRSLCGKPKDEKARLSNVMLTMLQKMEVNTEKFVDSLGPVSELV